MLNIQSLQFFNPFNQMDAGRVEEHIPKIELEIYEKGTIFLKRGREFSRHYYLVSGVVDLIDIEYTATAVEAESHRARSPLNLNCPTTESVRAKTDVSVFSVEINEIQEAPVDASDDDIAIHLTYPRPALSASIAVEELSQEDDWMSSLLKMPLFTKLSSRQVQGLFKQFETCEVSEGDTVVKEGCVGRYFYVIASGSARVTNLAGGLDKVLTVGQYFGEESIISQAPCNATVKMTSDGVLKRLDPETFAEFLQKPILNYIEEPHLDEVGQPYQLLDVRMPIEYKMEHLPGSLNIPLPRLRSRMTNLEAEKLYVVPDDAGRRADIAVHLLCQAGLEAVVLKAAAH